MTIQEQITHIQAQITEFMAVLPRITIQENKRVVNTHINTLAQRIWSLEEELQRTLNVSCVYCKEIGADIVINDNLAHSWCAVRSGDMYPHEG